MARPKLDLVGNRYDRLTVLKEVEHRKGHKMYECVCDCEDHNHVIVSHSNLVTGNTRSCGCLKAESEFVGRPKLGNNYLHTSDGYTVVFHKSIPMEDIKDETKTLPYLTVISTEQFEMIKDYTVTYVPMNHTNYIYVDGQVLILYRYLMDCPKGLTVDHINHDRRDNTLRNLRICTQDENNANSVRFINSTTGEAWNYDRHMREAGYVRETMMPENIADIDKDTIDYNLRSICTVEDDPSKWAGDVRDFNKDWQTWPTSYEAFIEEHKNLLTEEQYSDWKKKLKTNKRDVYTKKVYQLICDLLELQDDESEEDE